MACALTMPVRLRRYKLARNGASVVRVSRSPTWSLQIFSLYYYYENCTAAGGKVVFSSVVSKGKVHKVPVFILLSFLTNGAIINLSGTLSGLTVT